MGLNRYSGRDNGLGIPPQFGKGLKGLSEVYPDPESLEAPLTRKSTGGAKDKELIVQLETRFPLISQLIGRFGVSSPTERIPWFFALLMSAAASQDRGACCFVLDKSFGTTATVAVLLALQKLQQDFPEMAKVYAKSALSQGQRVKVNPSDYVYQYEGLWEEFQGDSD